jgi:cytidine deaminase
MNPSPDRSVVPTAEARARAAAAGGSVDQVMAELLPAAQALAIPPVSGFRVGAVAQGLSGALYLGANLEFPGMPLGASIHAEQAAIANAWAHGETGVTALAVTAAPCGHCRQFLNELVTADELRILMTGAPAVMLKTLLPSAFGPHDLGISGGLMQPEFRRLVLLESTPNAVLRNPAEPADHIDPLIAAALAAAEGSYAPYSRTYSAVALELPDGSVHIGRYAENAAFNPSLPPLGRSRTTRSAALCSSRHPGR